MFRHKFRLCVMAEHILLVKQIVQQAWEQKDRIQEQFLQSHLESLEEKVHEANNSGTILYLDEEEANALFLLMLKKME